MFNHKPLIALALIAASGLALADSSRDDIDPALQNASKPSTLTRAEVQADLALWRRAGVPGAYGEQTVDTSSASYQAAFAEYQRLRQGPAFLAEVRRIEGGQPVARQSKSGQPG
ncbi:DUF4148 domain-containing protein [Roseateles sp. DAIF2]|uniref:DUF4148 domain-containing protein n=1 Tax=Roseateles sp. DAIF2 TaxID=2714952 RepID=UPI0018A2CA05|nr:DUF4148 domain-containing protein [Roseateles sp. DAIF2]QPF73873.1 DUF4148 domain-containing protein [Roseateles sp. DAIF2]